MTGDVEVRVRRDGQVIATVNRPLRELSGAPAVTFKGELWPLVAGSIEIGSRRDVLPEEAAMRAAESTDQGRQSSLHPAECSEYIEGRPTWQNDPIPESRSARVIVDAGPGTGKTHAACARVASMISDGTPATRIMLVSFTRTAVVEIRSRIQRALSSPADAASIRIITLDSFAWAVQSGYTKDAKLTGGFDHNIEKARQFITEDDDVRDDLERIEHLIVDEAQDIVGPRADLVLELIGAISPDCGVTIFADRAQAIYEFSEAKGQVSDASLLDRLASQGFSSLNLSKVHRTSQTNLIEIFTKVRQDVLKCGTRSTERHVKNEIVRLANDHIGSASALDMSGVPDDALVLMRNRYDVLLASSRANSHPHRLRLSGLPICVRPWVAHVFWDYVQRRVNRAEFERRWLNLDLHAPIDCDEAWSRCVQVAGESAQVVDMHLLRRALARRNPPMLFCSPEFGLSGPIIGTIHASKGREAPIVYLYLPDSIGEDVGAEEARVMFVGATRAREQLLVGTSGSHYAQHTNGRVWRRFGGRVQVEVGRVLDLDPSGLVGRPFFNRQDDALESQLAWRTHPVRQGMSIGMSESLNWRFALNDGSQRLAGMSDSFSVDMNSIGALIGKRITWLSHARSIGIRTMVVSPDNPILDSMLEPWKSSGFMFAPLLTSLSMAKPRPR